MPEATEISAISARGGALTIKQKVARATRIEVLLDPDYAPDSPHPWTIKITRKQANELVGRAGKENAPLGIFNPETGRLLLYPNPKKETE